MRGRNVGGFVSVDGKRGHALYAVEGIILATPVVIVLAVHFVQSLKLLNANYAIALVSSVFFFVAICYFLLCVGAHRHHFD